LHKVTWYALCASVGNKKGSALLMHGVTMKFRSVQFVCTLDSRDRKEYTFLCLPVVTQTDYFPEGKTSCVES